MELVFFLLFLSFAQIMLHNIAEGAGISQSNGWLTMSSFCGIYFLFATVVRGKSSGGCLGEIEYAIATMFSFWALATQLGYLFLVYLTKNKNEISDEKEQEKAEITKLIDRDFWV